MNRPVPSFTAWSACVLALVLVASPRAAFAQRGPVPSLGYFVGKGHLAAGEYPSALRIFHGELAGGIKSTLGRGTDAVAYYAARGEARYHMGQYKQALDDFNAALNVFQSRPNWMVSVNFPAAIRPAAPGQIQNAPWGRSTRGAALGFYPDSYNSMQGQINAANNVLRQGGGVVQQARLVPVNAAELVRATALALRRRRELLGPTGRFDPLTGELISSLVGPVAPPTSWSRAWADVMLGMAYGAAGKDAQAKQVLVKGHLAAGQFDHPLTAQALFELGRIELTAGDYQRATYFFTEASYSAYQYFDPMLIEEAVRYAQITHLMANNKGVCPLLTGVSTWAKRSTRYSHLKASLAILTAENLSVRNDARSTKALAEAAQIMKRARGQPASPMGARYNFTAAMLYYQKGKVSDGDAALNAALVFQKNGGSLWLHHLSLAKKLAVTTELSGRETYAVLGNLLRDPQPAD
ncbi:MAG: tetratricopeptide repeat protein, partial [Planctomycetales bacterium]